MRTTWRNVFEEYEEGIDSSTAEERDKLLEKQLLVPPTAIIFVFPMKATA